MQSAKTKVVTSTELLDIESVPPTLAIVGAGVIGMEFASAFNTFGSKVDVYEFLPRVSPSHRQGHCAPAEEIVGETRGEVSHEVQRRQCR